MNKIYLFLSILISILSCKKDGQKNQVDIDFLQEAQRIHLATTTIDTHDDIDVENFTDSLNYSYNTNTKVNLPKMNSGALDVVWLIVYTKQGELNSNGYSVAAENAQSKFDAIHRLTKIYAPEKIGLATNSKQIDSLVKIGKKLQ